MFVNKPILFLYRNVIFDFFQLLSKNDRLFRIFDRIDSLREAIEIEIDPFPGH